MQLEMRGLVYYTRLMLNGIYTTEFTEHLEQVRRIFLPVFRGSYNTNQVDSVLSASRTEKGCHDPELEDPPNMGGEIVACQWPRATFSTSYMRGLVRHTKNGFWRQNHEALAKEDGYVLNI